MLSRQLAAKIPGRDSVDAVNLAPRLAVLVACLCVFGCGARSALWFSDMVPSAGAGGAWAASGGGWAGGAGAGGDVSAGGRSGEPAQPDCERTLVLGTTPGLVLPNPNRIQMETTQLVVGDFNRDGLLDLAAAGMAGPGHQWTRVLLGHGDGTFGVGPDLTPETANLPEWIAAGDLTGDGILDLAVSMDSPLPLPPNDRTVLVLVGQGDGSMRRAGNFGVGTGAHGLALADLNDDQRTDVVTANFGASSLTRLSGQGDGTLLNRLDQVTASYPSDVKIADLTRDGLPDIAVTSVDSSRVSLFFANELMGYDRHDLATPYDPASLALADLDADGLTDLVVGSYGALSVYLNRGHGVFGDRIACTGVTGSTWVATADFNEDGVLDIVSANGPASILLGHGDGTFDAPLTVWAPGADSGNAGAVGDFDGDGHLDVALPGRDAGIAVLVGDGRGRLLSSHAGQIAGNGPVAIATADLDGDGNVDVITANQGNGAASSSPPGGLSLLFGTGTGAFRSPVPLGLGSTTNSVAVADFNRDGTPDLAAANAGEGTLSLFLGLGRGTFADPTKYRAGASPQAIAALDLNGDANPDLVFTDRTALEVSVALGNGKGGFLPHGDYALPVAPSALVSANLNRDHFPDLALAAGGAIYVLLGDGAGGFGPPAALDIAPSEAAALATSDLNADGAVDIAVASASPAGSFVLFGQGDGRFGAPQFVDFGQAAWNIAIVDINGDGRADLLGTWVAGVLVELGRGDGTFRAPPSVYPSAGPVALATADFNHDGAPDVAIADTGSAVSILLSGCRGP